MALCNKQKYTVNFSFSGFDLTDDFIRFRWWSGLSEHGCF